jgi:hypothetical protein
MVGVNSMDSPVKSPTVPIVGTKPTDEVEKLPRAKIAGDLDIGAISTGP